MRAEARPTDVFRQDSADRPSPHLDLEVVQRHQQLGTQRAVVHVPRLDEQGAQKLQHHVVQLHTVPDHVHNLLDDLSLTAHLRAATGRSVSAVSRRRPALLGSVLKFGN